MAGILPKSDFHSHERHPISHSNGQGFFRKIDRVMAAPCCIWKNFFLSLSSNKRLRQALTHSPTHPLTHSLVHSFSHSLIHSPTHALRSVWCIGRVMGSYIHSGFFVPMRHTYLLFIPCIPIKLWIHLIVSKHECFQILILFNFIKCSIYYLNIKVLW